MKQRNLVAVVLLTFFIPFYDLFLIYDWQNARFEDGKSNMAGGKMVALLLGGFIIGFILCFIFVGIFVIAGLGVWLIVWHYELSNEIAEETGNKNLPIICLLGAILLPTVSFAMIQNEINVNSECATA